MPHELEETDLVTADVLDQYDDHTEVINGKLRYDVSPSYEHGRAQFRISAGLAQKLGVGGGGWWLATEVSVEYARDQSFVHDAAGWRRDQHPAEPSGTRVRLRPDWVCEILSESNWKRDVVEKFAILHSFGVPHYWIVDPRRTSVTVYRWEPPRYAQIAVYTVGDRAYIEPFDVELEVAAFFGEPAPEPEEGE